MCDFLFRLMYLLFCTKAKEWTIKEAARKLNLSQSTICKAIKSGVLKAHRGVSKKGQMEYRIPVKKLLRNKQLKHAQLLSKAVKAIVARRQRGL